MMICEVRAKPFEMTDDYCYKKHFSNASILIKKIIVRQVRVESCPLL